MHRTDDAMTRAAAVAREEGHTVLAEVVEGLRDGFAVAPKADFAAAYVAGYRLGLMWRRVQT